MLVVFLSLVAVALGCAPIDPNNPNAPTVVPGAPTVAPGGTHKVAKFTLGCSPVSKWSFDTVNGDAPKHGQSANLAAAMAAQETDVDAAIAKAFTDAGQSPSGVTSEVKFADLDVSMKLTVDCEAAEEDGLKLVLENSILFSCKPAATPGNGAPFDPQGIITVTAATPLTEAVWKDISGSVLGAIADKCIPRGPVTLSF